MTAPPWQREHRRPLPGNWKTLRRLVIARDQHCRWVDKHGRCTSSIDEVDHIDRHGPHELWNLQGLCRAHHKVKTDREKSAARWRHRQARNTEPHPGLQ